MDTNTVIETIETVNEGKNMLETIWDAVREYGLPGFVIGVGSAIGFKTTNKIGKMITDNIVVDKNPAATTN